MIAAVQTPTPNLDKSIEFYTQLGFKNIGVKGTAIFTDGKVVIDINSSRHARAGMKLFKSSWAEELNKLDAITPVIKMEGGYLLSDASGVNIYLIESEAGFIVEPAEKSFSELGNFNGISIETTDMMRSGEIYKAIGFTVVYGDGSQPWYSFDLNGFGLALMKSLNCPHLFFNPSLNYFNGKEGNPGVIAKVRELQIPITEEITHFNKEGLVDNVIIRDPGGLGFFLFND